MFSKVIAIAAVILTIGVGTATAQTPQGLKADGLRLQAMADRYGQIQGIKADGLRWQAAARAYATRPVVVASDGDDFNWGDAGIGAAASFVALLGIGGATVFVRRGRRTKLAL
jgi:hypothetical protein